ncbi:hypothetical protein QBC35DRAFT_421252 [Podospora australis]|uniref:Protein kinase domain-containing protein n=1 Tax=Podospora australis TaxID=1536484 RepID=A0AAN6WHZ1_9PEZI|nr:hypothetical protein QBC35DRAFT_421252 [Podospora australis]
MRHEVESQFRKSDAQRFLPEGSLDDLIDTDAILWELEDEEELTRRTDLRDLTEFIDTRARKLFAITIRHLGFSGSDLRKTMQLFKDKGFDDKQLPLKPLQSLGDYSEHQLAAFNAGLRRPIWSMSQIEHFFAGQWKFLVPVFEIATEKQYHQDFARACILPFTKSYTARSDKGSFGQVYKYQVHPNHVRDPEKNITYEYVAVKEVQLRDEEERQKMIKNWENEAQILQKMNSLQQKHIVRFLTAFRHGDKGNEDHYLMFEWADGGTLRTLWKTERPLTPLLVKEAITQLHGLATALDKAHYPVTGPTFRHGDLKPENILCFKDNDGIGTLKIADWGLAKQQNVVTELRSNKTSTEFGTRRYESPEEETGDGVSVGSNTLLTPGQTTSSKGNRRSRLYDMWAMGCITLEFVVWLLYGPNGLRCFNAAICTPHRDHPPFYEVVEENGKKEAKLHQVARTWIDHMAKDPRCEVGETSLGKLLEFVDKRLLCVKLPTRLATIKNLADLSPVSSRRPSTASQNSGLSEGAGLTLSAQATPGRPETGVPSLLISNANNPEPLPTPPIYTATVSSPTTKTDSSRISRTAADLTTPSPRPITKGGPERARADEFILHMEEIVKPDVDEDGYWLPPTSQPTNLPPGFIATASSSQPESAQQTQDSSGRQGLMVPRLERIDYGSTNLDNTWTRFVDNVFGSRVLGSIQKQLLKGPTHPPALCDECKGFRDNLWKPAFGQTYQLSDLETRATKGTCYLCRLFWRTCERLDFTRVSSVLMQREGSSININSLSGSALSIFRTPNFTTSIDETIQVGFGALPEATSHSHFEVLRKWVSHCNSHHTCNNRAHPGETTASSSAFSAGGRTLPTRLLQVGKPGDLQVRLVKPSSTETGSWIALSHQWGSAPHFSTTTDNLQDHLTGIPLGSLPQTFRDAVTVTRELGCPYLWIDSLCIIQEGADRDFNEEANRMEKVYSGAYCVIAADREAGHSAGFLKPRRPRDFVAFQNDSQSGEFYISEDIDDFNGHVLEGDLNRRGWVLQEHALARRTMYFTEWQTYWECGDGVRCETLVTMRNKRANFLGDSNFPKILMSAHQAERIQRCQGLFKQYSQLALTRVHDRPTAIDGLQARIISALSCQGGFGVLDEGVKAKGLLRRSLLWYCDGSLTTRMERITFPPDNAIAKVPSWSWMAYAGCIEYISPEFGMVEWAELQSPWSPPGRDDVLALVGEAREYDATKAGRGESKLFYDNPGTPGRRFCVVLGTQKGSVKKKYVILVQEKTGRVVLGSKKIYERVGAGYLPSNCIHEQGMEVTIH